MDEQLLRAAAALDESTTQAKRAEPFLASLVAARSRVMRDNLVMFHAVSEFSEGEKHFHEAIRLTESGDLAAAKERAAAAEQSYLEATLVALEKGPIRRLVNDAAYMPEVTSTNVHRMVREEIDDLVRAVEATRNGKLLVSTLRAKINVGSRLSNTLLGHGGIGVLAPIGLPVDPPPAPPGFAPGTFGAPPAPVTMRITDRTPNSMEVVWNNLGGVVETITLERSTSDGPWQTVREFGPAVGWQSWLDIGLTPDTLHRYRVRAQNTVGVSSTVRDNQAVGYTRTAESLPVWRVQLLLRVVDAPNAGTDDNIRVRLNSPLVTYAPSSNHTWLDHAPRPVGQFTLDDFQRGSEWSYDLNLNVVQQLGDITMISLQKHGTDAIGIAGLALLVNGTEVFAKSFGETPGTCLWLDEGDGHSPTFTVYHPELRAHPLWQGYLQGPAQFPGAIHRDELEARFEGTVGHTLHGTKAYWRRSNSPVRATRLDDQTLRVRLTLVADIGFLPDPDVDFTFDLRFAIVCNQAATEATLSLVTTNVSSSADFNVLVDLLSLGAAPAGVVVVQFVEHLVEQEFKAAWQPIVQNLSIDPPFPGACPKVSISLDASGDAFVDFRPV